jgi:hypothetical protein
LGSFACTQEVLAISHHSGDVVVWRVADIRTKFSIGTLHLHNLLDWQRWFVACPVIESGSFFSPISNEGAPGT